MLNVNNDKSQRKVFKKSLNAPDCLEHRESVELLLEGVQVAVYVTLAYGRLRSHLKLQFAAVHLLVQTLYVDGANVLQAVLCGGHQVGQVLVPGNGKTKGCLERRSKSMIFDFLNFRRSILCQIEKNLHRSFVHECSAHALCHAHILHFRCEVSTSRTGALFRFHRIQTAHSAVLFQSLTIAVEVFTRRFLRAGHKTPEHYTARTQT